MKHNITVTPNRNLRNLVSLLTFTVCITRKNQKKNLHASHRNRDRLVSRVIARVCSVKEQACMRMIG